MPIFTLIARVTDRLLLVESMDSEANPRQYDGFRKKAKKVFQSMNVQTEQSGLISDGMHYFIYLIDQDIVYLTFCENAYSKKLAYKFLEELRDEFALTNNQSLSNKKLRPFALQSFDKFIQKTKRLYKDTKSQRSLNKVSSDLKDINNILQRNIEEILDRGAKIQRASTMSDDLVAGAKRYEASTKDLVWRQMLTKYGFVAFFVFFFLFIILFYWWY
eukprot:TRINITY_DN8095_c0_g1_i1.p1 TRINITY_DN8095_c0_g1~~TRINITY_DN8095_c0_g1_i1.p1  ORF type:complete len:242 (-),score=50.41 TRINITY_DN8095_c0_g1_i1:122-772(-)